jgi:hypothetical protein
MQHHKRQRERLGTMQEVRQCTLDKTLEDSFPASDPLSTLPDPTYDSFADSEWLEPEEKQADIEQGTRQAADAEGRMELAS